MDWPLYWTVMMQLSFAVIILPFLSLIAGVGITLLVRAVVRGLPKSQDNDVDEIADLVLDRIVVIGREERDDSR